MISRPIRPKAEPDWRVWLASAGWERLSAGFRFGGRESPSPDEGRAGPKPGPVISSGAQVARLVAGSLQALGPAAPMAFTRNQYCVPLVRPVTVHFDDLPT